MSCAIDATSCEDTTGTANERDWKPVVTFLPNIKLPVFKAVSAVEVVRSIRSGRWNSEIAEYRCLLGSGESEKAKLKLPAVIIAGQFENLSDQGFREHSGLMVLDFDHLGPSLDRVRSAAQGDRHVFAAFVSPSGDGLKVVVRVRESLTAPLHSEIFRRLAIYAEARFGHALDSAPEVSRKCFVSYDPDAYLNEHAQVWEEEGEHGSFPIPTLHSNPATQLPSHPATQGPSYIAIQSPTLSLLSSPPLSALQDRIRSAGLIPTGIHQTHRPIFDLARLRLSLGEERGAELSDIEALELFRCWLQMTRETDPKLLSKSDEEYQIEFLAACLTVKVPLDGDAVAIAWQRAQAEPPPAVAGQFAHTPRLQQMTALCFQLYQLRESADSEFYLGCRDAGKCLEISHMAANQLLTILTKKKIIQMVKLGVLVNRQATTYRWTGNE